MRTNALERKHTHQRVDFSRAVATGVERADVREIESRLCGLAYERDVVAGALSAVDSTDYFGDVSRDVSREDVPNILCP